LCRHSAFFYRHLEKEGFIAAVIERCQDPDPATRKFACFALGNAAFHSDLLYPKLQASIRPILDNLNDADPKTRLNAVGALGNMVRCGEQLVPKLLECGAVQVRPWRVSLLYWTEHPDSFLNTFVKLCIRPCVQSRTSCIRPILENLDDANRKTRLRRDGGEG
jgi:hypothetical protein